MNKIFVPPIKIQGIKTKLLPLIKQNVLPLNELLWIEPFMGSGVVGFNLRPRRALFADNNPHLIAFYNALRLEKISSCIVREFLTEQGKILSERGDCYYYEVRERFNKFHEPLDFLFLNRSCFNGLIRFNRQGKFNVPYGHKPQRFSKAYVTKIVNQVRYVEECLMCFDWKFVCQDFRETITQIDDSKLAFIYCDPPYIGRHVDYYNSWSVEDERTLCNMLKSSKKRFMISTWLKNDFRINSSVEDIWKFCHKEVQGHFYHVGAKKINRNSIVEAVLMNYKPSEENNGLQRFTRIHCRA
ncbi:MAG: Dam family site-specific DNA-(adenine-N6)-methyltransferase [Selenomonadaceae bacterium]|nr:Dam family site-specific DNA-(adenine-N6)-methyltransferase [Selenomonadaceae bacterium]